MGIKKDIVNAANKIIQLLATMWVTRVYYMDMSETSMELYFTILAMSPLKTVTDLGAGTTFRDNVSSSNPMLAFSEYLSKIVVSYFSLFLFLVFSLKLDLVTLCVFSILYLMWVFQSANMFYIALGKHHFAGFIDTLAILFGILITLLAKYNDYQNIIVIFLFFASQCLIYSYFFLRLPGIYQIKLRPKLQLNLNALMFQIYIFLIPTMILYEVLYFNKNIDITNYSIQSKIYTIIFMGITVLGSSVWADIQHNNLYRYSKKKIIYLAIGCLLFNLLAFHFSQVFIGYWIGDFESNIKLNMLLAIYFAISSLTYLVAIYIKALKININYVPLVVFLSLVIFSGNPALGLAAITLVLIYNLIRLVFK